MSHLGESIFRAMNDARSSNSLASFAGTAWHNGEAWKPWRDEAQLLGQLPCADRNKTLGSRPLREGGGIGRRTSLRC